MPKRVKHSDINQLAHRLVGKPTEEKDADVPFPTKAQISAFMAKLGRKGGKIGGKRRLETLSSEQRIEIAKRAATARWKRK